MKRSLFFILLLFSSPSLLKAQSSQKLLLIGIDGVRSDALVAANTPHLDGLIANSTYSLDALNTGITISGPGWSNLLTGAWHDKHGVTDNSFSGSNYGVYPHFFQRIESYDASLNTASICNWNPINDNIVGNIADFKINVGSDAEVASQAANYLNNNEPDALFLHFDEIDGVGHANGFSPDIPVYLSAIESVDTHIGTVLNALNNRPNIANENWLILVTTDHGGINFSHGGSTFEEQNIFIIASGDQIPNQEITKTTLPPPNNCLNSSEELYFDGSGDYVSVANSGLFDFGTNQDFTIECRVRTDNAADVSIIGNKDWDSGGNPGFVLSFKFASGPEWKVNIGDGSNRVDINTGGEIADNEWHTLSVTFDRDGDMSMYEDGVFVTASNISNIGNIDTNFDLRFGADGLGAYAYKGAIAEVRVWNKVLDANAINNWYCTEIDNTHPDENNLIGYWKMKEDEGNGMVSDFSGNDNHGQIVDAIWQMPISYDYSNTPRQVDIAVTALTHLCVPIEPAWNLDGSSLITECNALALEEIPHLLNFTGILKEGGVLLNWILPPSNHISTFEIERSPDGFSFEKIGAILYQEHQQYAFFDKKIVRTNLFYRLKITDAQGNFDFSKIIQVKHSNSSPLKIYPNPCQSELFVRSHLSLKNAPIQIFNLFGKQVYQQVVPELSLAPTSIDISQLPAGIYWLKIAGTNIKTIQKVVIY